MACRISLERLAFALLDELELIESFGILKENRSFENMISKFDTFEVT